MKRKLVSVIVCVVGLFVSWQAFHYSIDFLFRNTSFTWFIRYDTALCIWIATVVILFLLKSKLKWVVLVFSSFVVVPIYWFCSGSIDYFNGRAAFQGVGMMMPGYDNLDEEYRVWYAPSSCLVEGNEFYTHSPNNTAIKFWTKLLGYQKGVFRGKYPTEEEVFFFFEKNSQSVQFTIDTIGFNTFIGKKQVKLKYQKEYEYEFYKIFLRTNTARIALLNNEVILFQLNQRGYGAIYLADATTGKIFAEYIKDMMG